MLLKSWKGFSWNPELIAFKFWTGFNWNPEQDYVWILIRIRLESSTWSLKGLCWNSEQKFVRILNRILSKFCTGFCWHSQKDSVEILTGFCRNPKREYVGILNKILSGSLTKHRMNIILSEPCIRILYHEQNSVGIQNGILSEFLTVFCRNS